MPNLDGTGPNGNGPQSGRGLVPCNPANRGKDFKRVNGRGRGNGRGLGRGFGRGRA